MLVMDSRFDRRWAARSRGMTVIELAVTMLVVSTLALIATPQIAGLVVAQRLRAAGGDLVSALYVARSESIKRNVNVTVRPATPDDWTSGWVATAASGEQIDRRAPPGNGVVVTRAPDTIVYTPSGRLDPIGAVRVEFRDAEGQPGIPPRCVIVDTAGLPRVELRTCS
jgi:prepilin-type N-terminal cleavage/methylation domain-containing protein